VKNRNSKGRGMIVSLTVRIVLALVGAVLGFAAVFYSINPLLTLLNYQFELVERVAVLAAGALIGGLLGLALAPWVVRQVISLSAWFEGKLVRTPLGEIVTGVLGLIVGLVIANLLGSPLRAIPWVGSILPTIGAVALGYAGWAIATRKKDDLAAFAARFRMTRKEYSPREEQTEATSEAPPKILDTSVIIDGRIADLYRSGFLEGRLIIPSFVLEELRHIADSSDVLKRNRGRRGLDVLNSIQRNRKKPVEILEWLSPRSTEVDLQLVDLAKELGGKILTNDFNLNKVAELHGVEVLNLNELANALKPVALPGERLEINVIKEGKEPDQGVGYLDDGTMIVVDQGKHHIGDTISVVVTSVLQTSAGRMIFSKPASSHDDSPR